MSGEIPEQYNGVALGGEGRLAPADASEFDGMIVDESMLRGGDEPLTGTLTDTLGQRDKAWQLAPVDHSSRWAEKMALGLKIPLFAIEVLPEGARRVRQQRLH